MKKAGLKVPTATKTGTTIVGIVFKVWLKYYYNLLIFWVLLYFDIFQQDGVVLGADTRATNDTIVAEKECEKIHYIAPNI